MRIRIRILGFGKDWANEREVSQRITPILFLLLLLSFLVLSSRRSVDSDKSEEEVATC